MSALSKHALLSNIIPGIIGGAKPQMGVATNVLGLKRSLICQSPGSSAADKPIRNRQVMHYLLVCIQLSCNTNGLETTKVSYVKKKKKKKKKKKQAGS